MFDLTEERLQLIGRTLSRFLKLPGIAQLITSQMIDYRPGKTALGMRESRARLRRDVQNLCRTPRYGRTLAKHRRYLAESLLAAGWQPAEQEYAVGRQRFANISVSLPGYSGKRYIIGAHYDACRTPEGNPGADDNASGVAVLLELARLLRRVEKPSLQHGLELVFYASEEPPWFGSEDMGSARHAAACSAEEVVGMICLDMVGMFRSGENALIKPYIGDSELLPIRRNFLAAVGDTDARALGESLLSVLGRKMPVLRVNVPFAYGTPLFFSDHRNYRSRGIPSVMLTDTAFLRNPNYHEAEDTPDTLNYNVMALIAEQLLSWVLSSLGEAHEPVRRKSSKRRR